MQKLFKSLALGVLSLTLTAATSMAASDAESKAEAEMKAEMAAAVRGDSATQSQGSAQSTHLSKLQIHGFLSQAYAEAEFTEGGFSSPTQDEVVLGIPEGGTTEYRNLALQFRYSITPRDRMVIQFSSRALGDSPIRFIEDDIELDWAFYERRIGKSSFLKAGRIQTPLGIFNEIRDVGTLLPFYRPSFFFYREGSFTSETVDGVMFGHTFGADARWSTSIDIYAGGWDLVEFAPPGIQGFEGIPAIQARADDAVGFHVWVNTPVTGLRFGGGFQSYSVSGGILERPGTEADWQDWHVSLDAAFERWVFRAEFRNFQPEITSLFPTPVNVDNDIFYAQLGYHPTFKWRIYTQFESSEDTTNSASIVQSFDRTNWREWAIGVSYVFQPNVVLKLETHFIDLIETAGVVAVVPNPPGPPLFQFGLLPAEDGQQTILSLSASF